MLEVEAAALLLAGAEDEDVVEDEAATEVVNLTVEVTTLLAIAGADVEDDEAIEDVLDAAEEV